MQICKTKLEVSEVVKQLQREGKTVGFVPTMGNLHEGHITLVEHAKNLCDVVGVSIFINPMQFGVNEDLDSYPRTFTEDCEKLITAGTEFLFFPDVSEMYPEGGASKTLVSVPSLSDTLCGASRPGHFTGVATVVAKLLNIVQADSAVFGLKDFQQLAVIRQMAIDLCIPTQIIGAPIVRAEDGLALSSRNGYLTDAQRKIAPILNKCLNEVKQAIEKGEEDFEALEENTKQILTDAGLRPDYFSIRDHKTLEKVLCYQRDLVVLAAAYLGNTRLIDNVTLIR